MKLAVGLRHKDKPAMISVVIPTLNAEGRLPACLDALLPGVKSLLKEVIVVDGGSADSTKSIADAAGARLIESEKGRGVQLAVGGAAVRGDYILFLHADTVLEAEWAIAAQKAMEERAIAAVFTLAFDAIGFAPRLIAFGAMLRTRFFALPFGDQGLLIRADVYRELGGYRPLPLMEDVEFIERLVKAKGRRSLRILAARAVTSPERYERDGYLRRVLRNQRTLLRYRLGEDPAKLVESYVKR